MNVRNAYNLFRLQRGVFAVAAVFSLIGVACMFGLAALGLMGFTSALQHGLAALACLGVTVFVWMINRTSIAFEMMRSRGLKAADGGNHVQAERLFREALTLADQFAQDDPRRGEVFQQLARVARRQGHYDDAETFGQQAIRANELAWGSGHAESIRAIEELADIYRCLARYYQARPMLEVALQQREARAADEPLDFARCLRALGDFWLHLERPDKAEVYLRRALEITNRVCPRSPIRLPILLKLCQACGQLKKLDDAEAFVQEAIGAAREMGPHSVASASHHYHCAELRRRQNRYSESEQQVRSAIAIYQEISDGDDAVWHDELHLLGNVLHAQGRWTEAEECYQQALKFRDEYLAPEDLATARLLEDFVELLELMGRSEEAHVMEQRAKFIRDIHSPFRIV